MSVETQNSSVLTYGKVVLDLQAHTAMYGDREIKLNPKEYSLLELFVSYPRHVLSYDMIIDRVWPNEFVPTQSCIRTHVKRLRKAFDAVDYPGEIVKNIRGLGYKLQPLPEADAEIISPSNSVLQRFFKSKAIEYLVLDDRWAIRYLSPGALRYCDYPSEVETEKAVWDGFPEFIGLESVFAEIMSGERESFELVGIGRGNNPLRPEYINFQAIVDRDSQSLNRLFIFFEDSSEQMLSRQRLVQYSNETLLLMEYVRGK